MKGYGQFCPVAKAAEIVAERWTPLVLRELMTGSRRFSELRRGLSQMSPSLLSKRLKELEAYGIIEKSKIEGQRAWEYELTHSGRQLQPIIEMMGAWGHRWARSHIGPQDLDAGLLMWDVRKRITRDGLPEGEHVIHFELLDAPAEHRRWWLVMGEEIDLCLRNPGQEVDLEIVSNLETMVNVWLGYTDVNHALGSKSLQCSGQRQLIRAFPRWFRSPYLAMQNVQLASVMPNLDNAGSGWG
jgi:DNA-binding HxlR family transcriptional regulator